MKLARSIRRHLAAIHNMLDTSLSNALIEAGNTQLRLLIRQAYGYHTAEALIAMATLRRGGLCHHYPAEHEPDPQERQETPKKAAGHRRYESIEPLQPPRPSDRSAGTDRCALGSFGRLLYCACMSTKRVIGLTVGFLAAAAAAWAMYQTALATECGVGTGITCPPDWHRQLLTGGIVIGIVAAFLGGAVVFCALALAVGLGAIAGGLSIDGDARTTMLIVGGASTSLAFLLLLLVLRFQARMSRARHLLEHGTRAIGIVVSVDDTGTTVNMNPRVKMTLRIEPLDGSAPFEGSKSGVVPRVDLPYPGRRYPVWFDPEDRTIFAVGTKMDDDASAENRQLFALAAQGNPTRPEAAPAANATEPPTVAEQLTQLNELRMSGALTEEEFAQQKAKLLEG